MWEELFRLDTYLATIDTVYMQYQCMGNWLGDTCNYEKTGRIFKREINNKIPQNK